MIELSDKLHWLTLVYPYMVLREINEDFGVFSCQNWRGYAPTTLFLTVKSRLHRLKRGRGYLKASWKRKSSIHVEMVVSFH